MQATSTDDASTLEKPPPCLGTTGTDATAETTNGIAPLPVQADPTRWDDWRWHFRNRIRSLAQLRRLFPGIAGVDGLSEAATRFPMAVTPYYVSLIRSLDASDPVFQMCVPQFDELIDPLHLMDDPLEEEADSPVPGLVHRYPDRALVIATSTCSVYCRHCTRKRVAGHRESCLSQQQLRAITKYLGEHPEIRDVIVSGGDPFTMTTRALETVLAAIRAVPSVDIIRIGTRTPVVLPMRITDELTAMLRRFAPLYVNTHFNHPVELTPQSAEACARLVDAGIPVGNQTVLLRGVNDDPLIIEELCRGLVRNRVRPYYMFQCDLVRGVEHFRTPITRGIEIMEYLRGRMSGLAIPQYVVDAPHGGGKIPLLPNYIVSMSPTHTVLRNFEGMLVSYPEPQPEARRATGRAAERPLAGGVWDLAVGNRTHVRASARERHHWQEGQAAPNADAAFPE